MNAAARTVRVFEYLERLDAFIVTAEFKELSDELGLAEWNPVVWIGRLFALDNDFGGHWFDNWPQREILAERAASEGMTVGEEDLMIVVPERFADGRDGPCHPAGIRTRFWKDVLKSLELSLDLLFDEARLVNEREKALPADIAEPIADLEDRIARLRAQYA